MRRINYLIIFSSFLFSCSSPGNSEKSATIDSLAAGGNPINKFDWLIGTWKIITPEGQLYETWEKTNDSLYSGNTAMIMNSDTAFKEVLSLKMIGSDLFYIPVVMGQNDNKPVYFKLVSSSNREFVFENPQHDFPQRIIYRNHQPDSLYARIEGNHNGEFRKEEFVMGRDK